MYKNNKLIYTNILTKGLIILFVAFLFIFFLLYIKHVNDTQDFIESYKNITDESYKNIIQESYKNITEEETKLVKNINNLIKESFSNINEEDHLNDKYLYPIKGLQNICSKKNLFPSFMPKACYVDGNLNSYSNCKCEDEKGNCKICYPEIKKDSSNANVIYDASK
jgi:hypothetical protein